jgi:hypothetical protein
MATQRQELSLRDQEFNFTPTTLAEAQEYAKIFATSGLCPQAYRGRPNDVLLVWQMGAELGLGKMQALRTIGCINGTPFAYGSGFLALIRRHKDFEDMREWMEGSIKEGNLTAFCAIKRKGQTETVKKFSMEDAKRAGLWQRKDSNYEKYPGQMLEWRARTFAGRTAIPEALYGLPTEDEVRGMQKDDPAVKPKGKGISGLEDTVDIKNDDTILEAEFEVMQSPLDELKDLIMKKNVNHKTIELWLKKANVVSLDGMSDEQILQGINFLKNKD